MTSKEIIDRYIGALEDDLQHYTMVDKDSVKAKLIQFELKEYKQIKQDLDRLEQLEKENKELNRQLDVFFNKLDKNTIRAIDLISYDLLDENTKLKKALDILKHKFEIKGVKEYLDGYVIDTKLYYIGISQEEYELLKEVSEYE